MATMLTDKQKAEMLKMAQEHQAPDTVDLLRIARKATRNAKDALVLVNSGLIADNGSNEYFPCYVPTDAGLQFIKEHGNDV